MFSALSVTVPRRGIAIPWLLLGGYTVAIIDTLAAMAYWAQYGIPARRILQSFAAWVLGPSAYHGGDATALLGALIYGQLLWGVVAIYHLIARHHPVLLRRPLACGALYGAVAYVAIFQCMLPLVFSIHPNNANLTWLAVCVVVYMVLVGIPCALFSRAAARQRR